MSPGEEALVEFERRSRAALEEGVARIDAHVRSRLSRARHAALAEIPSARPTLWRNRVFVPTSVAAAAALAAVVLVTWKQSPHTHATRSSVEDMELLADEEAFELIEDDGMFYEWAAAAGDTNGSSG